MTAILLWLKTSMNHMNSLVRSEGLRFEVNETDANDVATKL